LETPRQRGGNGFDVAKLSARFILAAAFLQTAPLSAATEPSSVDEIVATARQAYQSAATPAAIQGVERTCEANLVSALHKERDQLTSRAISLLNQDRFEAVDDVLKRERELDSMGIDFPAHACAPPATAQAVLDDAMPPDAIAGADAATSPRESSSAVAGQLPPPSPGDTTYGAEKRAASESDPAPPAVLSPGSEASPGASPPSPAPSATVAADAAIGSASEGERSEAPTSVSQKNDGSLGPSPEPATPKDPASDEAEHRLVSNPAAGNAVRPDLTAPAKVPTSEADKSVSGGESSGAALSPDAITGTTVVAALPPAAPATMDPDSRLAAVEREMAALSAEVRSLKREQDSRRLNTAAQEAPSAPAPAAGSSPDFLASTPNALPEGMPARVLIRYAGHSIDARRRAEDLASTFAAHGLEVADLREIVAPTQTRLSFSYAPDEALASRIGRLAGVAPVRQPLPKDGLLPRPGTVELVLAGR
jgi:trimeric autotransporter adhesin